MQFESFTEFLHMGGYAFYVWLSFGAGLVCLLGCWGQARLSRRKIIEGIKQFEALRARRQAAKQQERVL